LVKILSLAVGETLVRGDAARFMHCGGDGGARVILAGNTEAEWVSSTCDNFHECGFMDMKYLIGENVNVAVLCKSGG